MLGNAVLVVGFVLATAARLASSDAVATWQTELRQGGELRKRAAFEEAQKHYESALQTARELGEQSAYVGITLDRIAVLYEEKGNYPEAERVFRRALPILESALGPEDTEVANCLNDLAINQRDQGRYAEALLTFGHSLAIYRKVQRGESLEMAAVQFGMGVLYGETGRHREAVDLLLHVLRIIEKAGEHQEAYLATVLRYLGDMYVLDDRLQEADMVLHRASRACTRAYGSGAFQCASIECVLASLDLARGEPSKAAARWSGRSRLTRRRWGANIGKLPPFSSTWPNRSASSGATERPKRSCSAD